MPHDNRYLEVITVCKIAHCVLHKNNQGNAAWKKNELCSNSETEERQNSDAPDE